ncbi:MAG TPA: MBL fold metallo-hydrolase [Chloroflexota bacterium]|nr:MBL fold metallo-hydrolase [Chloroflexota bacterium]
MPGLEDELGDVVKKARNGLGLSVPDLAARTGMTEAAIKGLEVYTHHPDEGQVRRLAAVLQLRPDQLWALAQEAWSPPEPPWTIGATYTIDCLTNDFPEHCYVVADRASGECLIVDPGAEPERVVRTATQGGRRPAGILITHRHRDHTGAVVPVQQATGAPVFVQESDLEGVPGVSAEAVRTISGDQRLAIGAFQVEVLHTPGHTPGSATYVLRAGEVTAAFCGDAMFAGSAGHGLFSYSALLQSLRSKLATLPPSTVLYPGHGPATTVANELERNPFL